MILAADEYLAGLEVLHRMIRAVVAEFHLHRAPAGGEAEDLVAEADAEQRQVALQELLRRLDGVIARFGIARSVGEEDAVGLERQYLLGRGLRRNHRHAAAAVEIG